jgi:hypothetical protein
LLGVEGNQSMQISLNAEVPEKRYTHPTIARCLAGYIAAPYALEPLGKSIGETVSVLAEILDKSQAPRQDGVERLADLVGAATEAVRAASLTGSQPRPVRTGGAMTTATELRGAGWYGWHRRCDGLQCNA